MPGRRKTENGRRDADLTDGFVYRLPSTVYRPLRLCRLDRDDAAVAASIVEPHHARDFGEKRVVLAAADVRAGKELRAALPDEDRAARDELAAEALHAEPLRVRVAAV